MAIWSSKRVLAAALALLVLLTACARPATAPVRAAAPRTGPTLHCAAYEWLPLPTPLTVPPLAPVPGRKVGASGNYAFPVGPAGGGLAGTYPNPTVNALTLGGAVGGTTAASTLSLTGNASLTGVLPAANQAPQACAGDLTGTAGACVVGGISGSTPIAITPAKLQWLSTTTAPGLAQASQGSVYTPQSIQVTPQTPQGGSGTAAQNTPGGLNLNTSAPGTVGTAGAEAGYTVTRAGSQIAFLGSYTSTVGGLWLGVNSQPANSGAPTLYGTAAATILYGNGGTLQFRMPAEVMLLNSTAIGMGQPLGGLTTTPFAWSGQAAPNTVACGTGGTQTISSAQAVIPVFVVTTGTLTSSCTLDFTTNAPIGHFEIGTNGVTLGAFSLIFKNGTQSQTLTVLPTGGLVIVDTMGANQIGVN